MSNHSRLHFGVSIQIDATPYRRRGYSSSPFALLPLNEDCLCTGYPAHGSREGLKRLAYEKGSSNSWPLSDWVVMADILSRV
jgi:hypothetical protein